MAETAAYDDIVENLQNRAWMYFLLAAIVFASVFYIAPDIIEWLNDRLLPEDATLIYLSPAEYLILKMRVAGYAAISATAMIVMIHIWRIIRSRSMLPEISFTDLVLILVIALVLFSMGILYSLELMLPTVLEYLQNDAAQAGLETTYSLSAFYHFVFLLTFSLGLTFQLPLIIMLMLRLELATVEQLAEYRSHLAVVFFILAALITPPDVISQFLLAVPLMILYEISMLMGKFTT
ncbi:MAG: twin-arginine translocase subunit TatC [Dehalococcoidia bacterium]|nr:twin-arginine translocase subunit TatC [Dehalococcoidia bacterium]